MEAVVRFRNKFGISKDIISDTGLEKRLIDNDLNIDKTFQVIYG